MPCNNIIPIPIANDALEFFSIVIDAETQHTGFVYNTVNPPPLM